MVLFTLSGFGFIFLKIFFHGLYLEKITGSKVYMFRIDKQPNTKNKLPKGYFDEFFISEHPDESSDLIKWRILANLMAALFLGWFVLVILFAIAERLTQ
jgi:hypothetical protein